MAKLKIIKKADIPRAEDNVTRWKCPTCGASNADYTEQTARPLCEACGADFDWSEVKAKPMSRVSEWITETRLAAEARRIRDLKAFFGSATA